MELILQGKTYVVQKGDTLWSIAQKHLGSGAEWPRIFRFNNRPNIVKLGGKKITNPDEIYPGDIIRLPVIEGEPVPTNLPQRDPPIGPLAEEQTDNSISFTYGVKLEDSPPIVLFGPGYKATIKLQGTVILSTKQYIPPVYIGTDGFAAKLQREAEGAFFTLTSSTSFSIDRKLGKATYKNMMIVRSNHARSPKVAFGFKWDSEQRTGKMTGEIHYPELKGSLGDWVYGAKQVKIVIEVEPRADDLPIHLPPPPGLPVFIPAPSSRPDPVNDDINWRLVGAYVAAGALITLVLLDDFIPALWFAGGPLNNAAGIAAALRIVHAARAIAPAAGTIAPAMGPIILKD